MKKLTAFGVLWLLWGVFFRSGEVAAGARQACSLCIDVLLPSLFPFLVIALFACKSGAGRVFSLTLTPVTRWLLRLPQESGELIFFSLVGGYPTGARLLSDAVADGRVSKRDAGTLLAFCVGPGPAFVVLAVGNGMFASKTTGWILFIAHIFASLALGAIVCRRSPVGSLRAASHAPKLGRALAQSVSQAGEALLTVFLWVILCGAFSPLLMPGGRFGSLIAMPIEVTAGCRAAGAFGGYRGAVIAAFLLAFGGFGVLCQIAAIAAEGGIPLRRLIISRIVCGLFASAIAAALFRIFPSALAADAQAVSPMLFLSPNRVVAALSLCAITALSFQNISDHKQSIFIAGCGKMMRR